MAVLRRAESAAAAADRPVSCRAEIETADSSHSGHGLAAEISAAGGQSALERRPGDAAARAGNDRPGRAGRADDHFYRGKAVDKDKWATTFPMPVTMALMHRGQERFNIFCAACHGLAGEGGVTSVTSARAIRREDKGWVPPLSLFAPTVSQQPVGEIFNTITNGIRTMPSYASQIPEADRWAIILYVRALQRSQNADVKDVPEDLRPQLR